MHVIKLDGYNATVDNGEKLELGTFDSYGEEQLQIVKAPDWENLSVIATFCGAVHSHVIAKVCHCKIWFSY